MSKCIRDISAVHPKNGELYLLDCCILLYLFYTSGRCNEEDTKKYSAFYTSMIQNECRLALPLNLFTEFSNKFINLEYGRYLSDHKNCRKDFSYKDFRSTKEFEDAVKEIQSIVKNQFPRIETFDYNFKSENIARILDLVNKMDLNDIIYSDISRKYNIPIVTNDLDFINSSHVNIITTNHRMLNLKST